MNPYEVIGKNEAEAIFSKFKLFVSIWITCALLIVTCKAIQELKLGKTFPAYRYNCQGCGEHVTIIYTNVKDLDTTYCSDCRSLDDFLKYSAMPDEQRRRDYIRSKSGYKAK